MAKPVRYPQGVSSAAKASVYSKPVLWDMPALDPTKLSMYFEDFQNSGTATTAVTTNFIITTTEAGAGSASEVITDADGGVLLVTNDAADNDADFFQTVGELFKFVAGKQLWFKARFKVSDATQSDFVMGLQIRDTTPLDVTDGVFFMKDDGDASLDFHVEKNNTATSASAIATVVADTYFTVGFHYDGAAAVNYYVDDVLLGSSVTTNLPDDEEMTVSFGIQNGEAVAKTMSVDYILVAKER
jgi:hypothetical protein